MAVLTVRNGAQSRRRTVNKARSATKGLALGALVALSLLGASGDALAEGGVEGAHALAMHGSPAHGADFQHLSYADMAAPKGGRIVMAEVGGFDSLNPYASTGRSPWHLRFTVFESLMARSWGEPFTVYGLLAESVSTPEDRSYVEFTLRAEAKFSNGDPVTVEDVVWTWMTLRDKGSINLRNFYSQVERVDKIGERGVRFVFKKADRELPLLIGMMPVLPKSVYEKRDFSAADLETPVGSGPYVVESFEGGAFVRYKRNPDYWGADLPINKGRHNFDVIEHTYYGGQAVLFEAFAAGNVDLYPDLDPEHWTTAYDLPAVQDGRIVKAEIPHQRPSGMKGFVFNTRRALFEDRRVRRAIALAFDFAWANDRFFGGGFTHIKSTFSGSPLGFSGAATGREEELLAPFSDTLPPLTLEEGWTPPAGAGDGRNRKNLRRARMLLKEAGWTPRDGVLKNEKGEPFVFEVLVKRSIEERIAKVLQDGLRPLGIVMEIRSVDSAQYTARLAEYDYDMVYWQYVMSLSPGQEQRFYWGSEGRDTPQTRNYMGVADPAIDAMIDALLEATSREDFEAATRALDRVLSSGIYTVPLGYLKTDRVAHSATLGRPETSPIYGYVYIDTWWRKPE